MLTFETGIILKPYHRPCIPSKIDPANKECKYRTTTNNLHDRENTHYQYTTSVHLQ
ncbi:hypothetical protein Niako_2762 [Niastella koreensis GR20-10]|uniref:Uncharacterized protein n=1 Tax=Niastella koreensis (strain DSM 17620 / KACC 11465 / NBRC 106392 / GR20-10) TaxID=700598 RepID=G8T8C7_NIAKG|nr:hypothetical protein Niako_2762 [Niastella koreensis GR20-10]